MSKNIWKKNLVQLGHNISPLYIFGEVDIPLAIFDPLSYFICTDEAELVSMTAQSCDFDGPSCKVDYPWRPQMFCVNN